MKKKVVIVIILFFTNLMVEAQVVLNANGPGNTYEEITAVLAPGYNPVEVPDCSHTSFGRHIDELFDNELNDFVFRFFLHVTPDTDRCINTDRQRNEIKSYDKSPDNLLGIEDEIVVYKWKFKLDAGFQVSPNFTHVHQLKSVGGPFSSMPMYTITLRNANPDRLELRYAETDTQVTLKQSDLAPFKGVWLEATETIQYGTSGYYAIEIKKVSDGSILFEYENQSIVNWRPDAEFVRPKWGIYRSLNNYQYLRDEEVLFANFSIEEVETLSTAEFMRNLGIKIFPNPAKDSISISQNDPSSFDTVKIVNQLGQVILEKKWINDRMDVSNLKQGMYLMIFKKNGSLVATKRLIIH